MREVFPDVRAYEAAGRIARLYGPPMGSGLDARDSAELFLLAWSRVLGVDFRDLAFAGRRELMGGGLESAQFTQVYGGVPVHRASLRVATRPGAGHGVVLVGNDLFDLRQAELAPVVLSRASLLAQMSETYSGFGFSESELVVYVQRAAPPVMATYAYRLTGADDAGGSPEAFLFVVQASVDRLNVLEVAPLTWDFVSITGSVSGSPFLETDEVYHSIDPDCPCGAGTSTPLSDVYTRFRVTQIWYSGATWITDDSGDYAVVYPGTPGHVSVDLTTPPTVQYGGGRYVRTSGAGPSSIESATVPPPYSGVDLVLPSTAEYELAHVTAFYWLTTASRFAAAAAPGEEHTLGLDTPFVCEVNTSSIGNGGYSGNTDRIGLGRSGVGLHEGAWACSPNMANPVIPAHEHMHRMVYKSTGGTAWAPDLNEGFADAWGGLVSGTSCSGLGVRSRYAPDLPCPCPDLTTTCFRNLVNSNKYPLATGGAYDDGLVIAGAFWETREAMRLGGVSEYAGKMRRLLINELLRGPSGIDRAITIDCSRWMTTPAGGAAMAALNGTPHYDYIARGFGAHNLDAPGLFAVSYPYGRPANVDGGQEVLQVRVNCRVIPGLSPVDVGAVTLYYRAGSTGAFSSVVLSRPGDVPEDWPDDWEVEFPDPGTGVVEYYVTVRKAGEEYQMPDPSNGGAEAEAVYVAYSAESVTQLFADDFETDQGWTVELPYYPFVGAWERVVPTTYAGSGSPPCAPQFDYDGSGRCFVTDDNPWNGADYVGDGATHLTSPVIAIGWQDAIVRYALWYSNGFTHWLQAGWPLYADVFTVSVRECDGTPGDWIQVDTVGPFEIQSMGQWFEDYFRINPQTFYPDPIPNRIQIRFTASGFCDGGAVEAALDAFEVVRVQP